MDQPQVFGAFVRRYGATFRTSAYIKWGTSRQSLGSVLILNPGSADFEKMNPRLGAKLKQMGAAMGKIQPDPTMDQLIRLVNQIYEGHPAGKLQIYNLFNLQSTYSAQAINNFEQLACTGKITPNESLATPDELQSHPWILIGWGLHRKNDWKNLQKAKKLWMEKIKTAGIPVFGKQNDKGDYYHPAPLLKAKRDWILSELTNQFNTEIKPLIPYEKLIQRRYTLLKWNGKSGAEAHYIVKDNNDGTQSLIADGREPVWFHLDLAGDPAVADWRSDQGNNFDNIRQLAPRPSQSKE
ncbi:DUF1643 domain-containing protein [Sporolactobacillus pectinivorans]|uniref:DUF1643 domain-containing protein n=1 Tax=Sporolactobacillus pectinivorans TaxID=1591408 RepID=UPI000C2607BB|nr:DUF1643 domain-containing protein [Sporolactobacillus pectinivorans]